jgi:hypothetical protein
VAWDPKRCHPVSPVDRRGQTLECRHGTDRSVGRVSQAQEFKPVFYSRLCPHCRLGRNVEPMAIRNVCARPCGGPWVDGLCSHRRKPVHQVSLPALRKSFLCGLEVVGIQHVHAPLPTLQARNQCTSESRGYIAARGEVMISARCAPQLRPRSFPDGLFGFEGLAADVVGNVGQVAFVGANGGDVVGLAD